MVKYCINGECDHKILAIVHIVSIVLQKPVSLAPSCVLMSLNRPSLITFSQTKNKECGLSTHCWFKAVQVDVCVLCVRSLSQMLS